MAATTSTPPGGGDININLRTNINTGDINRGNRPTQYPQQQKLVNSGNQKGRSARSSATTVGRRQSLAVPDPAGAESSARPSPPSGARRKILNRRVGRNERNALYVLQAYVDAQRVYATRDRNGDGVLEYATQLGSSPGKFDGLYWPADATRTRGRARSAPADRGERLVSRRAQQGRPVPATTSAS